jgi:hypothetical protein
MSALPTPALDRLIKVIALLSSDHGGERSAAALKATQLLQEHKLTWKEFLAPAAPPPALCPLCESILDAAATWRDELAFAEAHADLLSDWEREFVRSIADCRRLSLKQRSVLRRLVKQLVEVDQ